MNKSITYILTVVVSSSGFLLWAHDHGSKLPLSNESGIKSLVMGSEINRDIRDLERSANALRLSIERNRSDLIRVQLNPGRGDHIIELENRIKDEIQDSQRDLDRHLDNIRDKKIKEQSILDSIRAA